MPSTETLLAEVLADIMKVERVDPESNVFDGLGADSLVMAQFCARLRKRPDLPTVSMKDVYRHPTIRGLATAFEVPAGPVPTAKSAAPARPAPSVGSAAAPKASSTATPMPIADPAPARKAAPTADSAPTPAPMPTPEPSAVSAAPLKPSPTPRRRAAAAPTAATALAEVLAEVVGVERVSPDSHFFDDLGVDSLVMARFCARLRKRPDLPTVSMKDVYRYPTIGGLAAAFADAVPVAPAVPAVVAEPQTVLIPRAEPESGAGAEQATGAESAAGGRKRAGTLQYLFCGLMQVLVFLGYSYLAGVIIDAGYNWVSAGSGLVDVYVRALEFGAATFLALSLLPIVLKWVLVGRWKAQEIPIWSLKYLRFWIVKTMIRANPLLLLIGARSRTSTASPILNLYLRALGAKIGRNVAIFSRTFPVCTDLLTIGEGTVIRKDSFFSGYRAHDGVIQTGPVTLGKNVFIGEMSLIDIGASMGDGAQLGHASSLHSGQSVPAGESWDGSPAEPCGTTYRVVERAPGGRLRSAWFGFSQILSVLVVAMPLLVTVLVLALGRVPQLNTVFNPGPMALTTWTFYRDILITSAVAFGAFVVIGVLVVGTIPRLLNLAIKPDKVYPLYGFHYGLHKTIARMTNVRFFTWLFGDSSYIVNYLRWIGYDLGKVVQTGSNFGMEVRHENPFLSAVGSGTMVADGVSFINADFSSTSFRLSRVALGARSFLGNNIAYSAQSTVGDNCLLATKVMVPAGGNVREGVGLLGAPSFQIPRSVERDVKAARLSRAQQRRSLSTKNRHNIVTMALYLMVRWVFFLGVLLLDAASAELYFGWASQLALALSSVVTILFTVFYWVLVERLVMRFRSLEPRICSIYDRAFWRHERYWKVPAQTYIQLFNGTPFKGMVWRMLGVKVGRRLFDDGLTMTERTLVTIGDDCTLNLSSNVQCHSQEDGAFKSDRSTLGNGVTLGVNAFIHYGTTVGDNAVIDAHSFLMKGEEVPPHARWHGNPASEVREGQHELSVA
ncbi:Pls/PosA family non-ribosomal peptide synthetase [Pseudonocardia sp. CA-142604]|uniref:Pls/PosA family non-ribosomal peptide synthetase n=1 Tax=Pseudonocardia sp. CA-142604 TaxID=3240024 RepID=UPI003D8B7CD4